LEKKKNGKNLQVPGESLLRTVHEKKNSSRPERKKKNEGEPGAKREGKLKRSSLKEIRVFARRKPTEGKGPFWKLQEKKTKHVDERVSKQKP